MDETWPLPEDASILLDEWTPANDKWSPKSKIVIASDEDGTMTIKGVAVAKIIASHDNVSAFFAAIGSPSEAMVEIFDIDVPSESLNRMEELFSYVEEII